MTSCATTIVAVLSIVGLTNDEILRKTVDRLLGDPRKAEIQNVPLEMREAVIQRLKSIADGSDSEYGLKSQNQYDDQAKSILLRFGDEQAIEDYFKERDHYAGKSGALRNTTISFEAGLAQPLLIPRLAKYFGLEDGDKAWLHLDEDILSRLYPVSIGSTVSAFGTMRSSPAFSPAVREWAEKTFERVEYAESKLKLGESEFPTPLTWIPKADIDLKELRKAMREWWKENAPAFAAKDYASVKPGAWLPAAKLPTTAGSVQDTTPPPAANAEASNPAASVGKSAPDPSPSSPLIYSVAIGSSLLLLASIVFFLRRKKSR